MTLARRTVDMVSHLGDGLVIWYSFLSRRFNSCKVLAREELCTHHPFMVPSSASRLLKNSKKFMSSHEFSMLNTFDWIDPKPVVVVDTGRAT